MRWTNHETQVYKICNEYKNKVQTPLLWYVASNRDVGNAEPLWSVCESMALLVDGSG
jgi:hypothetical protein